MPIFITVTNTIVYYQSLIRSAYMQCLIFIRQCKKNGNFAGMRIRYKIADRNSTVEKHTDRDLSQ